MNVPVYHSRRKPDGSYKRTIFLYDDTREGHRNKKLFHMVYYSSDGLEIEVGDIKLYRFSAKNQGADDGENQFLYGEVKLDENTCSLGQGLSYYRNLKHALPQQYMLILKHLNDAAMCVDVRKRVLRNEHVRNAMLRDSSAEKAFYQANEVLQTNRIDRKNMSFSYLVQVPYASKKVRLSFNFQEQKDIPYRMNILIGKNGTGKTQILTQLANEISGLSGWSRWKAFRGQRPMFDKVISISYSAFDRFHKRPSIKDEYFSNSYVYCGIQSEHGPLTYEELRKQFRESYDEIEKKDRRDVWKIIVQEILGSEVAEKYEYGFSWRDENTKYSLSSGQNILLCTITEVVAKIEEESLILFDEPELHLHPNAIASMMRTFYKLLESFNSYAIFATHSPLVVQETPSAYVHVLNRIDDTLMVSKPQLECFGENVTNITNEIFDVSSSESNYKTVLERLSRKMPYEEVLDLFDGKLSFHAMIYLKSCYESNKMSF